MRQLTTILGFFLIVISVNMEVYGQKLIRDSEFGKRGKLKIDVNFYSQLFYDKDSKSIFIASYEVVPDLDSTSYYNYKDLVLKINTETGKPVKGFGKNGKVIHSIKSKNLNSSGSENLFLSTNKIICLNYYRQDKEILLFDKQDGTISTFPKPTEDKIEFNKFIFFDEKKNSFLLHGNEELFWYDDQHNKKFIQNINSEKYYYLGYREFPAFKNSENKTIVLSLL